MRFEPNLARAQSQAALPKPGPEVKKLAAMVGRFTNEGEVEAGALGPNSPAMKVRGIDECSWTADRFGLVCKGIVDVGGTKETETDVAYYDPISKEIRISRNPQYGRNKQQSDGHAERQHMELAWPGQS